MCDNNVILKIENEKFLSENSNRIYQFMLQRKFCDVEVKIQNKTYYYHSNVLAASSEYFNNIISIEQKNDVIKRVNMVNEDSDSFQKVIHFFYTGKIEFDKKNIINVISVANKLIARNILEDCCKIVKDFIDLNNCLELYDSGISNSCEELSLSTLDFIKLNFKNVSETPEFLQMKLDLLIDLISCKNLDIDSEEDVYLAVKRWIEHDENERKSHSSKLLNHIKLPLVSLNILFRDMQYFCNNLGSECQNMFLQAIQYHTLPDFKNQINSDLTKPRLHASTLLVAGGWNNGVNNNGKYIPSEEIEMYDIAQKKWVKLMDTGISRRGCAMGLLRDEIIFAGGDDSGVNMVNSINITTKIMKQLPSMCDRRVFATGITNRGCFYVFGGCQSFPRNTIALSTGEKWDPKENLWSYVSPMETPRYASGGVILGNEFFLIGGITNTTSTDVTEAYCFATDKWRKCAPMNQPRFGPGVATDGNYIYAIAGCLNSTNGTRGSSFSLNNILSSVERYDPKTNTWSFIANISDARYLTGGGILGGKLISIGGAGGGTALATVESYDAKTNAWKEIESLVLPREFMGVFKISMKYLQNK